MSFYECALLCVAEPALVEQFDRLTGHHLSSITERSGLDAMIDEATGRDRIAMLDFLNFVWEVIWTRLPTESDRHGRQDSGDTGAVGEYHP